MTTRVSARDARARFAELTDHVRYTGEPVIVEKQGRPFVALIRVEDLDAIQLLRVKESQAEFARVAARAGREAAQLGDETDEDAIVRLVKRTREELYRERYGPE